MQPSNFRMIVIGGFKPYPKPEKKAKGKAFFIKQKSKKLDKLERKYSKRRPVWLQGKLCAVYPNKPATQVHHMRGRVGYADEWARARQIPLLLDERYWLAVSSEGHDRIERNPKWAKEHGFSLDRLK